LHCRGYRSKLRPLTREIPDLAGVSLIAIPNRDRSFQPSAGCGAAQPAVTRAGIADR
jgi:hypothetical protein